MPKDVCFELLVPTALRLAVGRSIGGNEVIWLRSLRFTNPSRETENLQSVGILSVAKIVVFALHSRILGVVKALVSVCPENFVPVV